MINFSIRKQIQNEIEEFTTSKVLLAKNPGDQSVRFLRKEESVYSFNQADTISIIDLYFNSKFESGPKDKLGQRKIFMNIGKFRTEVAAKQIDLDVKDAKFIPDEYSNPWSAFFMQKEFKEWSKETYFGELLNRLVDNFPKYGTVVLKKVKDRVEFVPLQLLVNDQTAESLQTARYVIETHPDMYMWDIAEMKGWDMEGLNLKYNECMTVHERYGYVPRAWLKNQNKETYVDGDENDYVDALVIVGSNDKKEHIFFAQEIKKGKRPYLEAHWSKQHGRWLGCGVMEDLVENQTAKNLIINLIRRSLHWSSKRIWQSADQTVAAKNLVRDVSDGTILEVGQQGAISEVAVANRSNAEFQQFLDEWERNSDQIAFTYEVSTGESLPSGTPFRLGVVLQNAVNSFFGLKREKLGLFVARVVNDFLVPKFIAEMSNTDRVVTMFSDEPGYNALKEGAMGFVKSEAIRTSLLSGQPVDVQTIEQAITPFDALKTFSFKVPKNFYKDTTYKFQFTITGEEENIEKQIESLTALYQSLVQQGDPRAEQVLARVLALSGVNISTFGMPQAPVQTQPQLERPANAERPTPQV